MRKAGAFLLALLCVSVLLAGCRREEAELPSSAVFSRFGVSAAFPCVAVLCAVSEEETLLRLKFTGADSEAFETVITFLKSEQFTMQNGRPAEKVEAASGKFFSFTAEREVSGEWVRVMAVYFVKEGSFDGESSVAGDLFVRFSVVTSENGVEQPAELPRNTDYILPQNLRAELSFGGDLLLAVKVGDSYYSERYGAAYFYLPEQDGTYTEYLRADGVYTENRTVSGRIAVEYLVFGLMLDAGEYDFAAMAEQESVACFGRQLSVYVDAHEGITETVWYDSASKLIFFCSVSVEGYGAQVSEVLSFDESIADFGSIPLP